ncbi:MAG TPA: hypothetical protein VGL17_02740 [Gemmatimonadaceae bacterium]|jgi:hypothetical protein
MTSLRFAKIDGAHAGAGPTAAALLSDLLRATSATDFHPERFITTGREVAVITPPAAWSCVQKLIAALETLDAEPCVARYEPDAATEVLQ